MARICPESERHVVDMVRAARQSMKELYHSDIPAEVFDTRYKGYLDMVEDDDMLEEHAFMFYSFFKDSEHGKHLLDPKIRAGTGQRWCLFSAGAAGSGKGTILNRLLGADDIMQHARTVVPSDVNAMSYDMQDPEMVMMDVDEFRYRLPSFARATQQYQDLGPNERADKVAAATQKEAGYAAEIALHIVVKYRFNFLFDSTLYNDKYWMGVFQWLTRNDYRIGIVQVQSSFEDCKLRAAFRAKKKGRGVTDEQIRKGLDGIPLTVQAGWDNGYLDGLIEFHNPGLPGNPLQAYSTCLEFPVHDGLRTRLIAPSSVENDPALASFGGRFVGCFASLLGMVVSFIHLVLFYQAAAHPSHYIGHLLSLVCSASTFVLEFPAFTYNPKSSRVLCSRVCGRFASMMGHFIGWYHHNHNFLTTTCGRGFFFMCQGLVFIFTEDYRFDYCVGGFLFAIGLQYVCAFKWSRLETKPKHTALYLAL